MDKKQLTTLLTGVGFIVLGTLLLITLMNWINANTIINNAVPVLLIISGFSLFSSGDEKNRRAGLGLTLFTFGTMMLAVRHGLISGKALNAVLGISLLIGGVLILSSIARKNSTKTKQ